MLKLKGDKAETPDMYLGATIQNAENTDGMTCWTMSSEKYVKAAVEMLNLSYLEANIGCRRVVAPPC